MKILDLRGQKFGRLTALFKNGKSKDGRFLWHCVCDCGNEIDVPSSYLTSGNTKSCGCLQPEVARAKHTKHGELTRSNKSKLYSVWGGMKNRCYRKGHVEFHAYGGRGITVCDAWRENYQAFKDWALASGYEEGLQIDRIDNERGYSPENCRWVTRKENCNNKRNVIRVQFRGELKTITEISGIPRSLIYQRFHNGWPEERLTIPNRLQK